MAGLGAATRIKRRLPEHEVNAVVPTSLSHPAAASGPAGRRRALGLPNLELAASREIGLIDADNVMPDLADKELTVSSSRGKLPVRYTDLVVEVPAQVRVPRLLRGAGNVFAWPQPEFGADPAACDAALALAASENLPVLVGGNSADALDAVLLAVEAGAPVLWARTGDKGLPGLDPLLVARALLCLEKAGARVEVVALPECTTDRLPLRMSEDGARLAAIHLPGEDAERPVSLALLTAPLLAGHPLLREEGVELDASGRICLGKNLPENAGLVLMGSGASLPGAGQTFSGLRFPAWIGGRETAEASAWQAVDKVCGQPRNSREYQEGRENWEGRDGVYGIRQAEMPGLVFFRAGFSKAEADAQGMETEYAVVSRSDGEAAAGRQTGTAGRADAPGATGANLEPLLVLSLLCEKHSRTLIGVQVLGSGEAAAQAAPLFGMAVTAMAEGTPVETLARQSGFTGAARLPVLASGILTNKLDSACIRGITPDEFLASRAAGAEFFTLDLRALPEWRAGHVPGAYSIPLPQLKKRLQDEVPRFTPLVLVSADGRDAYAVACRLAGLGATDLYVLDGGMRLWPYALEQEKAK